MVNSHPASIALFEYTGVAPMQGFSFAVDFSRKVKIASQKRHVAIYVNLRVFPMAEFPRYFPLLFLRGVRFVLIPRHS